MGLLKDALADQVLDSIADAEVTREDWEGALDQVFPRRTRTVQNSKLTPGDVIVCGDSSAVVDDTFASSYTGLWGVETPLGTLYLDPEQCSEVLIED